MELIKTLTSFEVSMIIMGYLFMVSAVALFYFILSFTTPIARHHKTAIIMISFWLYSITIITGVTTLNKLIKVPKVLSTQPKSYEVLDLNKPKITITFETPVNTKLLRVNTFPETDFEILSNGYFGNMIPYSRNITITPTTTYPASEQIMVYLSNIEGPFTRGYGGEYLLQLTSSELPTVEKITTPSNFIDVPVSASFTATLSHSMLPSGKFSVITNPKSTMEVKTINETTLSFIQKDPLKQGTEYTLFIYQTPLLYRYADKTIVKEYPPRLEKSLVFKTVSPPFINRFEPSGNGINPSENIKITFNQQMDIQEIEQKLTISPKVPLTYSWENENQTVILHHATFEKNTEYQIIIPKGVLTKNGAVFETDAIYTFKTPGAVTLSDSSPTNGATDISTQTQITLTFDQGIIPESLSSVLSITPSISGKTTIEKTTITFSPDKPLAHNTKYTITIFPGLKSLYGLPSATKQTFSFTTAPIKIVLPVPYYKQQSDFTCNLASARMLLSYRGITTDEKTLISLIGTSQNRGSGNPNKGYVPDYGTYWDAVSKGIATYRPYRLITSGKLSDIIHELVSGNPVMTWGQNGWSDPHDISWTAKDGTYIRAINGMHSAVVRGFDGPQENPTNILLNDPWRGQYSIPTDEFLRRWGYFNIALVVD